MLDSFVSTWHKLKSSKGGGDSIKKMTSVLRQQVPWEQDRVSNLNQTGPEMASSAGADPDQGYLWKQD